MSKDGKRLEALVAFIERTMAKGFKVTTNDRVMDDEGRQIAEFDVLIEGKVGTGDIKWLIECRDRPSSGAAPGSWIEQLVGRRARFNLSKVTAVSTTGFAPGVAEFAALSGIELRVVEALTPEHFEDWLQLDYVIYRTRLSVLKTASFEPRSDTTQELRDALQTKLLTVDGAAPILRAPTGELATAAAAFSGAIKLNEQLYDGAEPNGPAKPIRIKVSYPDNDYFCIDTPSGAVAIDAIHFLGELSIQETRVPLTHTSEYRTVGSDEAIAQVVTFAPQPILGQPMSVEFHRLASTGQTHITLRRLPNEATTNDPASTLLNAGKPCQ